MPSRRPGLSKVESETSQVAKIVLIFRAGEVVIELREQVPNFHRANRYRSIDVDIHPKADVHCKRGCGSGCGLGGDDERINRRSR